MVGSLRAAAAAQATPSALAALLAAKASSFSILYASHARWPLPPTPTTTPSSPLTISILDSSFNPAHLAHLAIATHLPSTASGPTAHLLLLSSKNVDKEPKTGEASPLQRLEMMRAVAREMERIGREEGEARGGGNVAVGVIEDEPTFVGKSRVLNRELEELVLLQAEGEEAPEVRLSFSQGYDTLIRFFDPKYYQSPAPSLSAALSSFFTTDHSSIACARRGDVSRAEEEAFLNREDVKPWRSRIEMYDLPEAVAGISSTGVRKCVKEGGEWEEMVLEGVEEIVKRDGLYR